MVSRAIIPATDRNRTVFFMGFALAVYSLLHNPSRLELALEVWVLPLWSNVIHPMGVR
jgi:hypothetical protein